MAYTVQHSDYIEVWGTEANPITITNANADYTISALPAVNWTGVPYFAQLFVYCNGVRDTSGAQNNLNGTELQISSGGWQLAGLIPQCIYVGANEYKVGGFMFSSGANIAGYLLNNTVQSVRLHDADCAGNNLIMTGLRAVVKIHFK